LLALRRKFALLGLTLGLDFALLFPMYSLGLMNSSM